MAGKKHDAEGEKKYGGQASHDDHSLKEVDDAALWHRMAEEGNP
jgi:hypothetical protein